MGNQWGKPNQFLFYLWGNMHTRHIDDMKHFQSLIFVHVF
uniref:Uncharacterized protein n=1 Tax=Anguilla anguilla TaxID=7936 RepID=A0A0E9PLT2_ANGAN